MKESSIRQYAELMKELELTGLEISDEKMKVRLERDFHREPTRMIYNAPTSFETPEKADSKAENDGCISICSPIVGVFYAAPAEDAEPYVKVGSAVKKGQTLCIVEAMKLMNEIPAETEGVIEQICVSNGQVVEYGTELFRIRS